MKTYYLLLSYLLLSSLTLFAQTDNPELLQMYKEDQSARSSSNIDWKVLNAQDSARRARVYQLIHEGKVVTGRDYYHTAMIFQHGHDTESSSMAIKQMKIAIAKDSTINRWLLAAAIDRDLMRRGQPQIYGTQYFKDYVKGAKWERYLIDSTKVTDQERRYYNVETLAEQKIKLYNMNLTPVSEYYASSQSVVKTIEHIRKEKAKGHQTTYNVSEEEINNFGYELMASGKPEEALKIFKLNTELYPKGFNTFDSYGECLLALNRKQEALLAYQKSLELNPRNENARKVLAENK